MVADALSRKAELAAISSPSFPLVDRIKECSSHDLQAKGLIELANQGKTRWLKDGFRAKGGRVYVPKWEGLRKEIIKECHDSKWAGHPGMRRTYLVWSVDIIGLKCEMSLILIRALREDLSRMPTRQG